MTVWVKAASMSSINAIHLSGKSLTSPSSAESSIPLRERDKTYTSRLSSPATQWIKEVFPEPGAPYYSKVSTQSKIVCKTYKEIAPTERQPTVLVPLFATQEVPSILDEQILYSWIKDYRIHRTLAATGYMSPVIIPNKAVNTNVAETGNSNSRIRGINTHTMFLSRNVLLSSLL